MEFGLPGNGLFILKESFNIFPVWNSKKDYKISIFFVTEEEKLEQVKTLGLEAVYFHLTFKTHLWCKPSDIPELQVIPNKTHFAGNDKIGFQQFLNIFLPPAGDSSN